MPTRRRTKLNRIASQSQRRPDIRECCAGYIDSLVRLYESTDPGNGPSSEEDKLEAARQAISIWWYLWAELMLWAQSHLAGYEMLKSHPELRERIEKLLGEVSTADSHVLEYVGVYFSWNHVNDGDPMLTAIHDVMGEEFQITMSDPPLRPIIRELIVSRSANSSFWRFPLGDAFFSLEQGQVDELVKPSEIRRQGNAVAVYHWKLHALSHAHFLVGKGLKKYRALEIVGQSIGQSVETLRSWEKAYTFDDDFSMTLRAAELAGLLEKELDARTVTEIIQKYGAEYFRHTSDVEYAKFVLRDLREETLDHVRDGLRSARAGK